MVQWFCLYLTVIVFHFHTVEIDMLYVDLIWKVIIIIFCILLYAYLYLFQ